MSGWQNTPKTAMIILADGTKIEGYGIGATGHAVGEICFNTAMTGYQEILSDPSYAGQIITFTFPHIGNVGVNDEDLETSNLAAKSGVRGCILKADITNPANYRATEALDKWLKKNNIIGISGVDTRALTAYIRENGMPNGIIAHAENAVFNEAALKAELKDFSGLVGLDLAKEVTTPKTYFWNEQKWVWGDEQADDVAAEFHVVAIDYGAKRNILRSLASKGAKVTIVAASTPASEILALNPDGIFLSNGPGDPAATGEYATKNIRELVDSGLPLFGICLGHQLLGLALGAKTIKMHQGHHGANHPVQDLITKKVEITSMNHGFAIDADTLPKGVIETHKSLFDRSNCGLAIEGKPVFSVQYHPEASPGPHDSDYLFTRFINLIREQKSLPQKPETQIVGVA